MSAAVEVCSDDEGAVRTPNGCTFRVELQPRASALSVEGLGMTLAQYTVDEHNQGIGLTEGLTLTAHARTLCVRETTMCCNRVTTRTVRLPIQFNRVTEQRREGGGLASTAPITGGASPHSLTSTRTEAEPVFP